MKTKLTKLITILILSIIAMNCKKSTEPLTLSDRAGTYTFENKSYTIKHYVVVNKTAQELGQAIVKPLSIQQ